VGFGEGGNLTFGKFESESSVFIRLRYRDMEIYWLVDHSDPEIWEAIAKWKRMGRVPIKFSILYSQPGQSMLETVGMPLDTSPFVDTGTQGFEGPTSFMWDGMAALTECPYLEAEALSHLSTVPFRLVIINVLVTRRWLTYLNDWKPDTSEA
jgi:hypothetical protein